MPSVQTFTDQWGLDLLDGINQAAHEYKMALFTELATNLDETVTTYSTLTNEVANGAGYTTGGKVLTGRVRQMFGRKACMDFDDPVWANASITARYAVLYNNTVAGKNVILILDFGANKTSTNGNFTVNLPAPGGATSLVRIPLA